MNKNGDTPKREGKNNGAGGATPLWAIQAIHVLFIAATILYNILHFIIAGILFSYIKIASRPFLKFIILPLYKQFLRLSKYARIIFRARPKSHIGRTTFLATSKYAWHAAAAIIAIGVSINNAASTGTADENFGRNSLFIRLTSPSENFIALIEEEGVDISDFSTTQRVQYHKLFSSLPSQIVPPQTVSPETQENAITKGGIALINPQIQITAKTSLPRKTIITYIVEAGDTISAIAEKFNISVNTILWANDKTTRSIIRPSDKLAILPVNGVVHTVRRNETVSSIAKKYNVPIEEIEKANESLKVLAIGADLVIPGAKKIYTPSPAIRERSKLASISSLFAPRGVIGDMFWPASCRRITQYFKGILHTGLDIACRTKQPIYAAEDGIVERSGWGRGYGNMIIINHGKGVKTLYGHIARGGILVSVGQDVSKGEQIALIGSTGRSTGPHVHFEVIVNGSKRNPLNFL